MWYVVTPLIILTTFLVVGRLLYRRSPVEEQALNAEAAVPPTPAGSATASSESLRAVPGAPNIDPPTDRHVTPRGTASIHRRTGRRSSSTGA